MAKEYLKVNNQLIMVDGKLVEVPSETEASDALDEQAEVIAVTQEQADDTVNQITGYIDGSPRDVYASLSALQTAYPTGAVGVYLTSDNGHWYYWNGTTWADGGVYHSSEDINEIKKALGYLNIQNIDFTLTENRIYSTATKSFVSSSMFSTVNPFFVKKGETVSLNAKAVTTKMAIMWTCNEDESGLVVVVEPVDTEERNYEYTATKDCYVGCVYTKSLTPKVLVYENLSNKVSGNSSKILRVIDTDTTMHNIFDKTTMIESGYWISTDKINNLSTCESAVIPCLPNKDLYIQRGNNSILSSQIGGIALYDIDKNIISIIKSEDCEQMNYNYLPCFKIHTPDDCYSVGITTNLNNAWNIKDTLTISYKPLQYFNQKGMRWAVFGDSLTEKNGTAEQNYFDYISAELGLSVVNYGASGTGYLRTYDEGKAFYQRMANINPDDFDFMTIFGSGNDCNETSLPVEIGGYMDSTNATLCGAINMTLDKFKELCPNKKIGIITPTPWAGYNRYANRRMEYYSDALIEICKIRGIPYLDLYRCSQLRPWDSSFRTEFYKENGVQDGGTHPNSKGHKFIAPMIREFIKKLI